MNTSLPLAFALLLAPQMIAQTMKNSSAPRTPVVDFATTNTTWQVVNDDVMGGISTSRFQITNGIACFSGTVSLENNGGFASARTVSAPLNVAKGAAFALRVRGDGRRYKFSARMDSMYEGPLYQSSFATKKDEWLEVQLPVETFTPTFRGRVLTGQPPLSVERVSSVGFLISDKQAGPFRLEIAWIKVVTSSSPNQKPGGGSPP